MGNSIFDNPDYESPFENWLENVSGNGQENDYSLPTISITSKSTKLEINKFHIISLRISGEYKKWGGEKFTLILINTNPFLQFTTVVWDKEEGVERGWNIKTQVKALQEGDYTISFAIKGEITNSISLNFIDTSSKCFCKSQGLVQVNCNKKGSLITENLYKELAKELGVDQAIFFAIAKQESKKAPFIQENPRKATLLLERHYVYRLIKKKYGQAKAEYYKNIDPSLCHNEVSPKGTYGTYLEQLTRLEKVKKWDYTIAIQSCSWGKFQTMGEYFITSSDYKDAKDFETAMNQCELQHFQYFKHFIKNVKGNSLITAMRNKDFEAIAKAYNGDKWKTYNPDYAKNIKSFYDEFKK